MKITCFFAWFDMWVGAYWDKDKRALYICLIPMCVVKVQFKRKWKRDPYPPDDCNEFTAQKQMTPDCTGDGHYMCEECGKHKTEQGEG